MGCILRRLHISAVSEFFFSCVLLQLPANCYFTQDYLFMLSIAVRSLSILSLPRFLVAILHRLLLLLITIIFRCIDTIVFCFFCCKLRRLHSDPSDSFLLNPSKYFLNHQINHHFVATLRRIVQKFLFFPAIVILHRVLSHAESHCKTPQEMVANRAGQCCHFTQGLLYI